MGILQDIDPQVRKYSVNPYVIANRAESPATLLEQLKRIHQQTEQTTDGQKLTGLTEMTPAQKSLFAALELALPTPSDLTKPVL